MSAISRAQTSLSENLLLLHQLAYSDLPRKSVRFNHIRSTRNTYADLRILDLIAVCLTTGEPGDVVAAAFDKREPISLVLAKTGEVLPADDDTTKAFFSALARAHDWFDLFPFLIRYSKANMDKRIRKLHQSITDLFPELQAKANTHAYKSMEEEFPHSHHYRNSRYPDGKQTVRQMVDELLCGLRDKSVFEMQPEDADKDPHQDPPSVTQYIMLLILAGVLLESRFLDQRVPNISFRWVRDRFTSTGEGSFEICADPFEAVERALGLSKKLPQESIAAITEKLPQLTSNWAQRRHTNPHVYTRIHAELRIILHLSSSLPLGQRPEVPIGCSKRSCQGCVLWINSFRDTSGISCVMSGFQRKFYENWALPGGAGRAKGFLWVGYDEHVVESVCTWLAQGLSRVTKSLNFQDDETSDSDSSDASTVFY